MAGKRKAEAERWFKQAGYDLKAASWNIQGGFHDTACFLAQQAAEKALKSLLYYLGARRTALLTHSLVSLVQEAGQEVASIAALGEEARELDLHYIPSRYPDSLPASYPHQVYTRKIAETAVANALAIVTAVRTYYLDHGEADFYPEEA
jgi:HEPN domain-containing protein